MHKNRHRNLGVDSELENCRCVSKTPETSTGNLDHHTKDDERTNNSKRSYLAHDAAAYNFTAPKFGAA